MKRAGALITVILLSGLAGAIAYRAATADRRRVRGDLASPLLSGSGISLSYLKNVGIYDVFRLTGTHGDQLMLVNSCHPGEFIMLSEQDGFARVTLETSSSVAFLRSPKSDGCVSTYAHSWRTDSYMGDQVWDVDGDGRFDLIKNGEGGEFWLLDNRWVRVTRRLDTDGDGTSDAIIGDTGEEYHRTESGWVRSSPASAPGGHNP